MRTKKCLVSRNIKYQKYNSRNKNGINNRRNRAEEGIGQLEYQMMGVSQKESGKSTELQNIKRNRKILRG